MGTYPDTILPTKFYQNFIRDIPQRTDICCLVLLARVPKAEKKWCKGDNPDAKKKHNGNNIQMISGKSGVRHIFQKNIGVQKDKVTHPRKERFQDHKTMYVLSYIVEISFIGERNRSTWRKPPTQRKSLANFIT